MQYTFMVVQHMSIITHTISCHLVYVMFVAHNIQYNYGHNAVSQEKETEAISRDDIKPAEV
jgi:hypothetical protein